MQDTVEHVEREEESSEGEAEGEEEEGEEGGGWGPTVEEETRSELISNIIHCENKRESADKDESTKIL